MTKPMDEAGKAGKEAFDTVLKSVAALTKGTQAIAVETTEYLKKSAEDGAAAWHDMLKARSFEKAVAVQNGYARSAYEDFVAEATKLTELYADTAKEFCKPFEAAISKPR